MTEQSRETAARLRDSHSGRELITVIEAAAVLGVQKRTLIEAQLLPIRKVASRYYVSIADLADFLTRPPKSFKIR